MSVINFHPLYMKRCSQWKVIRDCIEGEDAIKAAGEEYLPRASGSSDCDYKNYITRARWNNYTAQNLDGLHGLIFRRYPVVSEKKDELLKTGLFDNIDRKGTKLYQFLSDSVYDMMQTSFGGFLVDMPKADGPMTQEQADKIGMRPYLRYYPAESIINWGYKIINGVEQLAYVVLKESVDDTIIDGFDHTPRFQYRVLDVRSGHYIQRVFQEVKTVNEKNEEVITLDEKSYDIVINGKYLTELPFIMAPGDKPEKPMFYDLAMCNIGHYQKTADYERGVHLTTIPTGYVTGHRQNEDEYGNKEVVHLGHDAFLMFEEPEAKVGTLVFSGEGLLHSEKAIAQALTDMAILGSRLLANEGSESADSAKIHRAGENARLATFAKNVSEKITKVISIMADWMKKDTSVKVALCTDYDTLSFDANAINAIANLSEAGNMPLPALYWNLKNGEYIPPEMTFEIFCTMLSLPTLGYSPIEQAQIYKTLMAGENVQLEQKVKTIFNNQPKENPENKEEPVEE